MSFQEKSARAVVVIVALTYGAYLALVLNGLAPSSAGPWQPVAVMVVLLVVALATAHAVLAARGPGRAARDQSDRQINRDARATGAVVLAAGSVAALIMSMAQIEQGWIANVILAALVGSELAAGASRVEAYRRRRMAASALEPG